MTARPDPLRAHLLDLLQGGHAHVNFEDAVRDLPARLRGKVPRGLPYSAWQLVEHMRLTQEDILLFSRNYDGTYESPEWPEGYWPSAEAPLDDEDWDKSIAAFRADRAAFEALISDAKQDLFAAFPWGEGQTLLREALLIADHTSYHLGQLIAVRRLVGAWPE
jgi:DinB superfamily